MMLHEHDCANACRAVVLLVVLARTIAPARQNDACAELHDDGAVLKAMCSARIIIYYCFTSCVTRARRRARSENYVVALLGIDL